MKGYWAIPILTSILILSVIPTVHADILIDDFETGGGTCVNTVVDCFFNESTVPPLFGDRELHAGSPFGPAGTSQAGINDALFPSEFYLTEPSVAVAATGGVTYDNFPVPLDLSNEIAVELEFIQVGKGFYAILLFDDFPNNFTKCLFSLEASLVPVTVTIPLDLASCTNFDTVDLTNISTIAFALNFSSELPQQMRLEEIRTLSQPVNPDPLQTLFLPQFLNLLSL